MNRRHIKHQLRTDVATVAVLLVAASVLGLSFVDTLEHAAYLLVVGFISACVLAFCMRQSGKQKPAAPTNTQLQTPVPGISDRRE